MFAKINRWLGVRFDGSADDIARFTVFWTVAVLSLAAFIVFALLA